ncbi:hypothetical protein K503DRAFT_791255 [Rhizopogon vinicolor AM-OR11-026]|uniref:G-protein coupled receptors family 1 profile domain-containing protein n=1 Tax=Rhizopogon vinicolor AM-OR11-026 TaxID=1314800 RepID=A0A1B7N747_9AGAM|nr:hypothetical protein K503DRAFT_791255 [Rhizopogon vinicolor AM-OR11-026]
MINWKNPGEIETEGIAFAKAVYVLFGIYIWEICVTCSFEVSIFMGRRKLAWPLVLFVFLCRYSMLFALTLYIFISVAGSLTILSASTSLMIRAMALWEWKRWAVLSMLGLSLGQWAILIRTMTVVQASWNDQGGTCVVVNTNHILLILSYVYTMSFDFVILVMTTFALGKRFRHEALSSLLFRNGLVYFLITSTCNAVPAVGLGRSQLQR